LIADSSAATEESLLAFASKSKANNENRYYQDVGTYEMSKDFDLKTTAN